MEMSPQRAKYIMNSWDIQSRIRLRLFDRALQSEDFCDLMARQHHHFMRDRMSDDRRTDGAPLDEVKRPRISDLIAI
jgi:hypothetical protein